jgi:hypothetical protein
MSVKTLATVVLLASSGFARADSPVTRYRDAMDACAGRYMLSYDDGVSPAREVARVLVGLCRRENHALYSTVVAGHSHAYVVGFNHANEEEFTGFVLWHRANKSPSQ